jgi:hypothetical protein
MFTFAAAGPALVALASGLVGVELLLKSLTREARLDKRDFFLPFEVFGLALF